ncbi:MAG: FprA family A-type flavoprotein, partial [Bacteroidetes bacterium]|nr:FprA family A-type flavoprotein [Bacteroidota bacterium]
PILRSYWEKYVAIAAEYAQQEIENREREGFQVFIPYVSAYGYTKKIAEAIAEGVKEVANVSVELCDIQDKDFHFLDHKIAGSNALIIGSPTFNQNILPQIYQLFASINPIRDRGKAYAAFGSFGWSGEGVGIIENALSTLKLVKLQEGMKVKFSPKIYNPELKEFGKRFGESLTQ